MTEVHLCCVVPLGDGHSSAVPLGQVGDRLSFDVPFGDQLKVLDVH